MRRIAIACVVLAACGAQAADEPLTFEVASVKPASPDGRPGPKRSGGPGTADPGRFTFTNATVKGLLLDAFSVENYQIIGPSWLDSRDMQKFDIAAKVPAGATKDQFNLMLQNLLVGRFKLVLHRETREFQVYELTVAKGGPKFKESTRVPGATLLDPADSMRQVTTDKDGLPWLPPGHPGVMNGGAESGVMQSARQQPMSVLVGFLQSRMSLLGLPVLDKTGLTGTYDYALKFYPPGIDAPADTASDPAPDVFEAVQQYLGLKLEKRKDPIDVVVVDSLEKTPTEN